MPIEVHFSKITPSQYKKVISYYNSNKPEYWLPISKLDRAEGGFSIPIEKNIYSLQFVDSNQTIKQVRWEKKILVTKPDHYPFNEPETFLLYQSLQHVFGANQVSYTK